MKKILLIGEPGGIAAGEKWKQYKKYYKTEQRTVFSKP